MVRVPTSWECVLAKQEGSPKLCALLGFSILRFFCLFPLFFLVWFAVQRTVSVFTAKDLFKKFDILPKSVIVLVDSEK